MSDTASTDNVTPTLSPGKKIRAEIEAYEREYRPWMDRAKGVIDRYRDIRPEPSNQTYVLRKYNILWANVRVLKPTLYARIPKVQVERRFKDADPIGRLATQIAERMGDYVLQTSSCDEVFKQCVQDNLLPGRATAWVNYEVEGEDKPVMEDYTDEAGAAQKRPRMKDDEPETEFEKIHEAVNPEYVDWRELGHSPRRTWEEVCKDGTVWRCRYFDKEQLVKRFGAKKAETIPLDRKIQDKKEQTDNIVPQATIYEAWHKPTGKVYWLHKEVEDILDESDPPVKLESFWPTTRPLWATTTNGSLIPIPDFIYYQDQANELDIITNRIARITDAIKAVGVYDKSAGDSLARILQPSGTADNTLIPVDNWAAFREKGGLAGTLELVPLDMLTKTLEALYVAREQIINVIFQITGIADIIRGESDPRETATAQKQKAAFGSINIRDRQAEVASFCRDIARLIIECGIQMFEPKLIAEMTMASSFCPLSPQEQQAKQMGQPVDMPQSFVQALKLLKDDRLRSFHIDIETDSTIALNDAEEKESVTEFVGALASAFQAFAPAVQMAPELMPVVGETLLYATRRYRAGRSLEQSIEQAVAQIGQKAQQPKPPDPKMVQAQANAQSAQAKAEAEKVRSQADITIAQIDAQSAQADAAAKGQQAQIAAMATQQDGAHKQADISLRADDQQFNHALDARKQLHDEAMAHATTAHQVTMDHASHKLAVKQANKPTPRPQ